MSPGSSDVAPDGGFVGVALRFGAIGSARATVVSSLPASTESWKVVAPLTSIRRLLID